jgi:UDP-glucose-4-epimerase GalE
MTQTILVTGGAGYIGSHACKALSLAGYTPVVYDNLSHGHAEMVKWGSLEIGDICDATRLREVFAKQQPAAVMHFAGLISVGESVEKPELYHHNNVVGSMTLLAAMAEANIHHLVFSSTCAVHGYPKHVPIEESEGCAPINPYGESKLAIEHAIKATNLNAMILRYFNAAGADAEGDTGELHEPETHIIPLAILAAMHHRPFHVFGTDYPTPDGTAIRDYIHVTDLARAHVLALTHVLQHGGQHTLNLGTGIGTSVREMVAAIEETASTPLEIIYSSRRAGDPPMLVANASRARELLQFSPEHSSIRNIVHTAWQWHQKNHA